MPAYVPSVIVAYVHTYSIMGVVIIEYTQRYGRQQAGEVEEECGGDSLRQSTRSNKA